MALVRAPLVQFRPQGRFAICMLGPADVLSYPVFCLGSSLRAGGCHECAELRIRGSEANLLRASHCVRYFTGGDFFPSSVLIFTNVRLFITQGGIHQFGGALFLLGVE